jgi:hypothetical protein
MTVRMTSPGASKRAARRVRGSSARAERIIVIRVCRQASVLSSFTRYSDDPALPTQARLTMLFVVMIGKRQHLHAATHLSRAELLSSTDQPCTGLRALALLLP